MLKQRSFKLLFVTAVLLFLFPFIAFTSVSGVNVMEDPAELRPDILTIDTPRVAGTKEMPPVHFKHELHTQAVEGQCAKCHDQKDKTVIFKFKRLEDADSQALMDLYHDNCVACHRDMKVDGRTGPLEAECRDCHNADFQAGSSWQELPFDRSLHYRHESAKSIVSAVEGIDTNCNVCHHSYNEKSKEIFYQKGEESACAYCHTAVPKEGIRAAQQAAHDSCVACHLALTEKKTDTGPITCSGCHLAENQAKVKIVENIPRLDRNQPDAVLLTGWATLGNDAQANEAIIGSHMNPVPFDHVAHEKGNQSCKSCHHESLKKCNDCHTAKGEEKGGFIKLAGAMHAVDKSQSCIGCHNEQKKAKNCAGCHAQMPVKAFEDNNCESCHNLNVKGVDQYCLKEAKEMTGMALTALENRADAYESVLLEKVPEVVAIETIAKEYQASQFPHRMVVESVFKKANTSAMAKAFHGGDLTLCVGCHHNSPASYNPPKCASCHGKTPDLATGKPGLKGAYHGQCITCHQKMEVASVLPTDCIKCHEKK